MKTTSHSLLALAPIAVLASCSAPSEDGESADESIPVSPAERAAISVDETSDQKSVALANSAWRLEGEDGAIYTTYLDGDGTYRDFKNGEPFQDGEWQEVTEGRVCFTPSNDERRGECWVNEPQDMNGSMRTTSDSGKTVELRQVTYVAASQD